LLQTQSTLLTTAEGIDVHVGQLAQHLDAVEDRQDTQVVDVDEGHCRCGTLVELVPVTKGPGSIFEGFDTPRLGAVTKSDEEILPVPMIGEMRVWAGVQETEPEISHSSAEVEALAWVEWHPMHSPSPGWDVDNVDAALAAFPELL
jgi:hypothetical protein